jgi:hypothetical protein
VTPEQPIERSAAPLAIGLLGAAGSMALIVAAFVYSVATVLPDGSGPSSAPGVSSIPVVSSSTTRPIEIVAGNPEAMVLTLCNGQTVAAAVGSGPVYHQYVIELMAETRSAFPHDSRFADSNCGGATSD